MRRVVPIIAAVALLATTGMAHAASRACVTGNAAIVSTNAFLAVARGPAAKVTKTARALLEAGNAAADTATAAHWPQNYVDVLAEQGYLASTVADAGRADNAEIQSIAAYAVALRKVLVTKCGGR